MATSGTSFDSGATACPFVALELDRDRRSERPDYRHRCYAEPMPAPRTIAHQERFCLSPNFPGCPIFQDWAVRAAARAVPLPQGLDSRHGQPEPRVPGASGLGAAALGASAADERYRPPPTASPPSSAAPADPIDVSTDSATGPWPDSMAAPAPLEMPPTALGATLDDAGRAEQLGAFDTAPPGAREPDEQAMDVARGAPPMPDDEGVAPVPAFLSGRATRPRSSPKLDDRVVREDVVPSWEIDGRYGAQAGGDSGGSGVFGRLATIIAVIVILGLGVFAVLLVPGLLNAPAATPRPSLVGAPSAARPSPAVSGVAVGTTPTAAVATGTPAPTATDAQPTPATTPEASPILYRIRAGDILDKVARKHGVTVAEILSANPQIVDPNHIEVGQVIFIPLPAATPAP